MAVWSERSPFSVMWMGSWCCELLRQKLFSWQPRRPSRSATANVFAPASPILSAPIHKYEIGVSVIVSAPVNFSIPAASIGCLVKSNNVRARKRPSPNALPSALSPNPPLVLKSQGSQNLEPRLQLPNPTRALAGHCQPFPAFRGTPARGKRPHLLPPHIQT